VRDNLSLLIATATALILAVQFIAFAVQAQQLKRSVDSAELTAQRQLRAYVSIERHTLDAPALAHQPLTARVVIKNFGQTPAYKLTCAAHIIVAKAFEAATSAPSLAPAVGTLGPGAQFHVMATLPGGLNLGQLLDLQKGDTTLFIDGLIRYLDIFNRERWTSFRVQSGAAVGAKWNELVSCSEGNETDGPD